MAARATGCIYCGVERPYNDEHVIPAGSGAGNAWQLKGLVCTKCNNDFSKLEGAALRRGVMGFARKLLQERGRDRGAKSECPTFEGETRLVNADGPDREAKMAYLGKTTVWPFIMQTGPIVDSGGPNIEETMQFFLRLEKLLKGHVTLIRARSSPERPHTALDLELGPDGYFLADTRLVEKPGRDAVWLEIDTASVPDGSACILSRDKGSIALQLHDSGINTALDFLTMLYANIQLLMQRLSRPVKHVTIDNPRVHVATKQPPDEDMARLLSKIGFNLMAHSYGEAFCRDECFDFLCAAIVTGNPNLEMKELPETGEVVSMMRRAFNLKHWLMLATFPNDAGGTGLMLQCSFYGGPALTVCLAWELPVGGQDRQDFFAVDYDNHEVQRLTLAEVIALAEGCPPLASESVVARP